MMALGGISIDDGIAVGNPARVIRQIESGDRQIMNITQNAKEYHEKMFPGYVSKFLETDPEFIERLDNFAFDEVVSQCLPFIGYPRSLNAISCINKAVEK